MKYNIYNKLCDGRGGSMIIDLKRIFVNENSTLPVDYSLDLSEIEHSGNFPLKKPVKLEGAISNKAGLVRFEAKINYIYEAPCDRCGVDTRKPVEIRFDKSLATSIEGEDSDTILLVPDMKLDVDEFLYTEIVVSLPLKHLCSNDCKGICIKCGKNLNEGDCNCNFKEIDPRLQALADLLNE